MDEALYTFLEKRIGDKNITFYKKLSEVPQPKDLPHQDNKSFSSLMISLTRKIKVLYVNIFLERENQIMV